MDWSLRLACDSDIPALEALIECSVRELQSSDYSAEQMDGARDSSRVRECNSRRLVSLDRIGRDSARRALYRAFDYEAGERNEVPLANGLSLPVVRMSKNLVSPTKAEVNKND